MGYLDPVTGQEINDPFLTGEPALNFDLTREGLGLPTSPQPAPAPAPVQTGGGYSVSEFDPADAERRLAFGKAATAGMEGQDRAELGALYGTQMGALDTSVAKQKEGQQKVNDANIGLSEATRQGYGDMTTEIGKEATDAATEEAKHTNEIAGAMAKWQESSARTTAMRVDPDRLMKNAGPTGRLGFGAAAFAEGFLGAKGIKVRAIDLIQDRINKDINAQLTDIEQGREATSQFRALYEAARNGASDARDVRDRLNAMYLNAATYKAKERVAGAQSELERASGEKLLTDLDAKRAEAEATIQENILNKAQERRQFREEMRFKYSSLAQTKRAQDWEESPMNPKNAPKMEKMPAQIFAPAGVQGDQPVPVVTLRPEFAEGPTASKLQEDVGSVSSMIDEARDLRTKMEDFNGRVYSGALSGRVRGEQENLLRSDYLNFFNKYRKYLTGAAGSEVEDKRYAEAVPFPSFTGVTPKESANAFNAYVLHAVKAADKSLSGFHDPRAGKYEGFAPAWQKEAEDYGKKTTQTTEGFREGILGDPGAVRPSPDAPGKDWKNYINSFDQYDASIPRDEAAHPYDTDKQPAWASVLDQRLEEAAGGDRVAQEYLWHSSMDTKIHPNRRKYAEYLLQQNPRLQPTTADEAYPFLNP